MRSSGKRRAYKGKFRERFISRCQGSIVSRRAEASKKSSLHPGSERTQCITFSSAHLISACVDHYSFSPSLCVRRFSRVPFHASHILSISGASRYTFADISSRTPKELSLSSLFYQERVLVSYFLFGSARIHPLCLSLRDWSFSKNLILTMIAIFSFEYSK